MRLNSTVYTLLHVLQRDEGVIVTCFVTRTYNAMVL